MGDCQQTCLWNNNGLVSTNKSMEKRVTVNKQVYRITSGYCKQTSL
jgi:hypothetical protein